MLCGEDGALGSVIIEEIGTLHTVIQHGKTFPHVMPSFQLGLKEVCQFLFVDTFGTKVSAVIYFLSPYPVFLVVVAVCLGYRQGGIRVALPASAKIEVVVDAPNAIGT